MLQPPDMRFSVSYDLAQLTQSRDMYLPGCSIGVSRNPQSCMALSGAWRWFQASDMEGYSVTIKVRTK